MLYFNDIQGVTHLGDPREAGRLSLPPHLQVSG